MHRQAAVLLAVVGAAVGLALLWTYPLAASPATHILGAGAGDNVTFVWNCWWMRYALNDPTVDFFYCPLIFAPWGSSLVLHTHTAFPAMLAATLLGTLPIVLAQNVLIWTALTANTCAMFALAWDRTRDPYGAGVAALIFGCSPFLTAHLHGHWNLIHLWSLPLVALWFPRALAGSRGWLHGLLSGGILLCAIYTDYYIAVYSGALLVALLANDTIAVTATKRFAGWTSTSIVLLLLAVCAFGAAFAISISGGGDLTVGALQVRAHTPTNALRVGWIAVLLATLLLWRPRLRFTWKGERRRRGGWLPVVLTGLTVLIGSAPLAWRAFQLVASGDYASPAYAWRSGPRGVDLLTLLIGSPYHPTYGTATRSAYEYLGLDPVEQIGWIGVAPLALAVYGLKHRARHAAKWALLASAGFVWALGPSLRIAGTDVGLPLPQLFQQFLPVLSNARMPGRAMVLVFAGVAMLAAIGTTRLRQVSRPVAAAFTWLGICVAILLDFWPAPYPVTRLQTPRLYSSLSDVEDGAILELPMGVRDGFGETGRLDHTTLFYQTSHERPLFGGFVARLSPQLKSNYSNEPLISSLLRLSSGGSLTQEELLRDRAVARAVLRRWRVKVVVVHKRQVSDNLRRYVHDVLRAEPLSDDGERALYAIRP